MKLHLPFPAGRAFSAPAAAAAAAQGDTENMTTGKDEENGNDGQQGIGADAHGYPSFLYDRPFGVRVLKVLRFLRFLRFDSPFGAEGCGGALEAQIVVPFPLGSTD